MKTEPAILLLFLPVMNRLVLSSNYFKASKGKFIQTFHKFSQNITQELLSIYKFLQSIRQFLQTLNKFFQSICRELQTFNKLLQTLNKFLQSMRNDSSFGQKASKTGEVSQNSFNSFLFFNQLNKHLWQNL